MENFIAILSVWFLSETRDHTLMRDDVAFLSATRRPSGLGGSETTNLSLALKWPLLAWRVHHEEALRSVRVLVRRTRTNSAYVRRKFSTNARQWTEKFSFYISRFLPENRVRNNKPKTNSRAEKRMFVI